MTSLIRSRDILVPIFSQFIVWRIAHEKGPGYEANWRRCSRHSQIKMRMPPDFSHINCLRNNEFFCNLATLTIPVVLAEMDGYTFQCFGINYQTNTVLEGIVTELNVTVLSIGEGLCKQDS